MAFYRHYFVCTSCGRHLTSVSDTSVPVSLGDTHAEAAENGAKQVTRDPDLMTCGGLGRMMYCSGTRLASGKTDWMNAASYKACIPPHKGTEEIRVHVPSAPPPDWVDFTRRVAASWTNFVDSGYSPALRGVNNHHEYRAPAKVSEILRSSGGAVMIDGGGYTISESMSAGVSLKRSIPGAYVVGNIRSFIFHL